MTPRTDMPMPGFTGIHSALIFRFQGLVPPRVVRRDLDLRRYTRELANLRGNLAERGALPEVDTCSP